MVAKLSARRGQTTDERDAELRPVSVWGYLQRYIEARRALPPSERTTTMPKRSLQLADVYARAVNSSLLLPLSAKY